MFRKRQKDIVETFRENFNSKITIAANLTIVTFLDVILDAQEDIEITRDQTTHLYILMSAQTIHLISSMHYQMAFRKG